MNEIKELTPNDTVSVKAFDGEDKVLTYKCALCPACGKWLHANPAHKFCSYCGQQVKWVGLGKVPDEEKSSV